MDDVMDIIEVLGDVIIHDAEKFFKGEDILCREFNLKLISAENLPNVRKIFDNRFYAKVTIGGDESTEQETEADEENGLDPIWNCTACYNLSDCSIMQGSLSVVVALYSQRTLGDRCIGEVSMSLKALFDSWSSDGSKTFALPINGAGSGAVLNVSCSFGEQIWARKPAMWKQAVVTSGKILFKLAFKAVVG